MSDRESHPTWVRGLKRPENRRFLLIAKSHPTWVRGLKQTMAKQQQYAQVAPYVGAWIETHLDSATYNNL